jgi:hypothetical protein
MQGFLFFTAHVWQASQNVFIPGAYSTDVLRIFVLAILKTLAVVLWRFQ